MKISLSWLAEYVDLTLSPEALAHGLTMAGLEVEKVEDRFARLDTVLAAHIVSVAPHPAGGKLTVCGVDAGRGVMSVVCGAENAVPGLVAALALPGTVLADGTVVEEGSVRGVPSPAMLCSAAELGLGEDASGLLALAPETAPGTPVNKAFGLSDSVFELNVTPNRADCLSFLGVAREVAALCGTRVRRPAIALPAGGEPISDLTGVEIKAPKLCPRYVARLLKGVTVGPSPFWLADRLRSVGLRPINNIVDVTNFVMMETGQPLHAFDFDLLSEHRIVVRTGEPGEAFTTLDGRSVTLTSENLMICDGVKPVALAGVMGGQNSEIGPSTQNVLIESAHFSPMSVRKTAKRLGYHTDASHRFERGTDPDGASLACARAAQLMLATAGGTVAEGECDAYPLPFTPRRVVLSTAVVNRHLGTALTRQEIAELLAAIDIPTEPIEGDELAAMQPSFRPDIGRSEDLVEEVARLYGYDKIPVTAPNFPMEAPPPDPAAIFSADVRRIACGMGFFEAVNFSFMAANAPDLLNIPEGDPRRRMLPVANPLAADEAVMRTSLVPGILKTVAFNMSQQNRDLRLFEAGKVFLTVSGELLPNEPEMLVLALSGCRPRSWHSKDAPQDFYDAKGAAEGLISALGIRNALFEKLPAAETCYFRPGRAARVLANGSTLGRVGEIRRDVLSRFGVKQPVFLVEMDMEALFAALPEKISYSPLPKFPSVARDLTLVLSRSVPAAIVCDKARELATEWLESVDVFDVYEKKPNTDGKKSLSLRLVYRAADRTLTDAAVNLAQEKITSELLFAFDATLSGT